MLIGGIVTWDFNPGSLIPISTFNHYGMLSKKKKNERKRLRKDGYSNIIFNS